MMRQIDVESFFCRQMDEWPDAAAAYARLDGVLRRSVTVGGVLWYLQCNPARIASSAARTDARSIASRRCFLCEDNRPEEQSQIRLDGYDILVNPFPVFPRHFVIASTRHEPQHITGNIEAMARFSAALPGYTVFFNGPGCGASAPDHLHFQAVPSAELPVWNGVGDALVSSFGPVGILRFVAATPSALARDMVTVLGLLPVDASGEPMVNVLVRSEGGVIEALVVPRRRHRPACYFAVDAGHALVSPASIDVAGVLVLPRECDFKALDVGDLDSIFKEVCFSEEELKEIIGHE